MRKKQIVLMLFLLMFGLQSATTANEDDLQDPLMTRIAVIIPEIHISSPIPDPAGETAIIRKLLEAGFSRVVDQAQIDKIRDSDVVRALVGGDAEAAIGLGLQLGVDVIIVGEAFSELAGRKTAGNQTLFQCRARVEARAIRTDNGRIIAANGSHATGLDITEFTSSKVSLNNAGELMGDYMVEQLFKQGGTVDQGVRLTVTGIAGYSRLTELERALRGLRGVKTVRINEYAGGAATIDLTVEVSVQTLAAMISDMGAPRMEIMEISGSAMRISIR